MSDVHDILDLERPPTPEISKAAIFGLKKDGGIKKKEKETMKRPEGMHRELYALLYSTDGNQELPPLLQTDSLPQQGYKSNKARLGMRKVRPWAWVQFNNPARKDGAMLYHWRRLAEQNKEYPFAQFNKRIDVLKYSDMEYSEHLTSEVWSRSDTDTLLKLCQQFDMRWPIIHDRWPYNSKVNKWGDHPSRSIEDLKERYYQVTNVLKKIRNLRSAEGKQVHYDSELERKRKLQLSKLGNRTKKQVEEEQELIAELRRIEARKKERERKTQDLQKLIAGGETGADPANNSTRKYKYKKKLPGVNKMARNDSLSSGNSSLNLNTSTQAITEGGIKFSELRTTGVVLRSQILKLPPSVGQKKLKAVEHLLTELNIDLSPMCVEEVCSGFNELRSDLVIMYELRNMLLNYVFDLQTLKHQYETIRPTQSLIIPPTLAVTTPGDDSTSSPLKIRGLSDVLDSVASSPSTPNRKRKAALEQSNILKKIKART